MLSYRNLLGLQSGEAKKKHREAEGTMEAQCRECEMQMMRVRSVYVNAQK